MRWFGIACLMAGAAWGQDAPKTVPSWVTKANAKKTPCKDEGMGGGGADGFNSWSATCEKGFMVYKDTTKETQEWEAKESAHKSELAAALVSRCLTAAEFKEVTSYGYSIYTRPMQPYMEADMQSRFNSALLTQQIIRQNCPAKAETPTVGGQYAGNHYAPNSEPQATHKLESEWAHMMTAGGDPSSCEHRDDCDIPATMEKRETDADSNWCNTCTKDSCTAMNCLPKKVSVDVPVCPKTPGKHYVISEATDGTQWCRPIKEAK